MIGGGRGDLGADIREFVRGDQIVGLEQRQVGVEPRIESHAVVLDAELPGHYPVPEQRQGAEQLTGRSPGDARHISDQSGEDFAWFDEHRRASGGKRSENLAA